MEYHRFKPYIPLSEARYPKIYLDVPSFLGSKAVSNKEELKNCDVVILGIPWEGELTWGSWSGCELAPMHIRKASLRYGGFIPEFNVDVLEHYNLCDYGDVCIEKSDTIKTFKNIYDKILDIVKANAIPIALGGDHSITIPVVKAIVEHGCNPLILHLDAHYDSLPSYRGNRYARCCPIRRLVDEHGIDPKNIFQVGIRGPRNARIQHEFAKENGIKVYTVWDLRNKGLKTLVKEVIEQSKKTDGIYITLCMDILDSSAAPAAAGDPLGLTSYELINLLISIVSRVKLIGMDLVEIYPPLDVRNMTSHLAVWIILYTLAASIHR